MRIDKVKIMDDVHWNGHEVEILGIVNPTEARKLEKLLKKHSYYHGIGWPGIDLNGYHVYDSIRAGGRIRFNPTAQNNTDLKFHLMIDGKRAFPFFRAFQKKYGRVDESKIKNLM